VHRHEDRCGPTIPKQGHQGQTELEFSGWENGSRLAQFGNDHATDNSRAEQSQTELELPELSTVSLEHPACLSAAGTAGETKRWPPPELWGALLKVAGTF
jgi:hypothetical protein